jgi:hypothetical protein
MMPFTRAITDCMRPRTRRSSHAPGTSTGSSSRRTPTSARCWRCGESANLRSSSFGAAPTAGPTGSLRSCWRTCRRSRSRCNVAASSYWRSHGFAFARFRSAARNNALSDRAAGSQCRPHRLDRDRVPSRRSQGRLSWFGCRAGGRARAWPAAAQHPAPGMQVSRVRRPDRSGGRSPALALLPRLASNGDDLGGRPEAPRDLGWPKEPSAPSLGAPLLAADHHQSKARLTARRPAGEPWAAAPY